MSRVGMKELGLLVFVQDQATDKLKGITGAASGLGGVASTVATGGLAAAAAGVAAVGAGAAIAGKAVWDFSSDLNSGLKTAQAQLGLTDDELVGMKDSAKAVFEEGFGENISAVVSDMAEVKRVTGLSGDALEQVTMNASTMAKVFDVDVAESVKAASSVVGSGLVPNMETAQDLITKGFQEGLPEDWIDTLNEYSGDFQRMGFTAEDVLAMMNAGIEAGAHNTDVLADGFREMNIRMMEGGEGVTTALADIGFDMEEMAAKVSAGEATWADYSAGVIEKLSGMDDKVAQNRIGVELFGTKWEDVGGDVFLAAGKAQGATVEMAGATEKAGEAIDKGFGAAVKRMKRTVISNFEPLGAAAGNLLNKMEPHLDKVTAWLGKFIPRAIDQMQPGFDWMKRQFNLFSETILPYLRRAWERVKEGWDEARRMVDEKLRPALQELWDSLGIGKGETGEFGEVFGDVMGWIIEHGIDALFTGIAGAIDAFVIAAGIAKGVVNGLKKAFRGVRDAIQWVIDKIVNLIDWLRGLGDSLPPWATPGSPTPLELGLRGIADAAKELPRLGISFGGSALGHSAAAGPTYRFTQNIYTSRGADEVIEGYDVLVALAG